MAVPEGARAPSEVIAGRRGPWGATALMSPALRPVLSAGADFAAPRPRLIHHHRPQDPRRVTLPKVPCLAGVLGGPERGRCCSSRKVTRTRGTAPRRRHSGGPRRNAEVRGSGASAVVSAPALKRSRPPEGRACE